MTHSNDSSSHLPSPSTFLGYWGLVLGELDAESIVAVYALTDPSRSALCEWLSNAEVAAWLLHGEGHDMPQAWARHHQSALTLLEAAALAAKAERDALNAAGETAEQRIERLKLTDIPAARLKSLQLAHQHVDDETFTRLSDALRVSRATTVVLPKHRLEGCSRGRGWARKGHGDKAEWGERESDGYRVGPGNWTVGGHDGFTRKREDSWTVEHVQVGAETWTIAN